MGLDANSSPQIFRRDYPMILAMRRDLAVILPTRLVYQVGGYTAGQVLGQYTSGANNTLFAAYTGSGGASGLGTAVCVLFDSIDDDGVTANNPLARSVFGGYVFYNSLIGIDSNAITNLKATKITDSRGTPVLKF